MTKMYRSFPFAAAAAFCLAPLVAQGEGADVATRIRSMPGAQVHFELDGPAKLSEAFAETNFGALMADPEMVEFVRTKLEEGMAGNERMLELVQGYRGRVIGAVAIRMGDWGPEFDMAFYLTEDGETSLDEFAELVDENMQDEQMSAGIVDLEVGPHVFRVAIEPEDEEMRMVLPVRMGDGLLLALSNRLEPFLERLLLEDAPVTGGGSATTGARSPVEFSLQFQGLLGEMAEELVADAPITIEQLRSALSMFGIDGLGDLRMAVAPRGDFVESRTTIELQPGGRDVISKFFPKGRTTAADLAPRGSLETSWTAMRLDLAGILRAVLDAARQFDESGEADQMISAYEEQLGVRIEDDLLATLGSDLMFVEPGTPDFEDEMAMMLPPVDGALFALSLTDGPHLAETIDKILRAQGLHAAMKRKDYQGATIASMAVAGLIELHYTITENHLVLALGRQGADLLRGVVDRLVDRREGREPGAFAEGIAKRIEALGDGWEGLQVGGLPTGQADMLAGYLEEPEYFIDEDGEFQVGETVMMQFTALLLKLAPRYDLAESVTVFRRGEDQASQVTIW